MSPASHSAGRLIFLGVVAVMLLIGLFRSNALDLAKKYSARYYLTHKSVRVRSLSPKKQRFGLCIAKAISRELLVNPTNEQLVDLMRDVKNDKRKPVKITKGDTETVVVYSNAILRMHRSQCVLKKSYLGKFDVIWRKYQNDKKYLPASHPIKNSVATTEDTFSVWTDVFQIVQGNFAIGIDGPMTGSKVSLTLVPKATGVSDPRLCQVAWKMIGRSNIKIHGRDTNHHFVAIGPLCYDGWRWATLASGGSPLVLVPFTGLFDHLTTLTDDDYYFFGPNDVRQKNSVAHVWYKNWLTSSPISMSASQVANSAWSFESFPSIPVPPSCTYPFSHWLNKPQANIRVRDDHCTVAGMIPAGRWRLIPFPIDTTYLQIKHVSINEDGIIYAVSTHFGGHVFVHDSTKPAVWWTEPNVDARMTQIAVTGSVNNPSQAHIVGLGPNQRVYKSLDQAKTWIHVPTPVVASPGQVAVSANTFYFLDNRNLQRKRFYRQSISSNTDTWCKDRMGFFSQISAHGNNLAGTIVGYDEYFEGRSDGWWHAIVLQCGGYTVPVTYASKGADGETWALSSDGYAYRRPPGNDFNTWGRAFTTTTGGLVQIDVANTHHIVGINAAGQVFVWEWS